MRVVGGTGLDAFDALKLGVKLAGMFNPSWKVIRWIFHGENHFYEAGVEAFDKVVDKGIVGFGESCFGCS